MSISSELWLLSLLQSHLSAAHLRRDVPLGAPDLHGALLHMGQGTLLAGGQVGIGPGRVGTLCKEFCFRASCMFTMGGPSSRL